MAESVFRIRDYAEKSIDFQVILKLGIWGMSFAFCVFYYRLWAKKLLQIDNIFQVLLLLLIVISCFYAPNTLYSLASAFSLIAVLFMLLMSSSVLTNQELLRQIILGCTLVIAASIAVYFINPDFGQMKEWVNGTLVSSGRLSGITGTANACGYIAAMALLALYYYRKHLSRLGISYWLCITINLAGLLMSNSRTAIAALILSLLIASIITATTARLAGIFLCICIALIALASLDMESVFQMLSRSGDANEIMSGTGRTAIWATVADLISQRPLFGWGYAASNTLIPSATADVGFTANHAHNAFLQVALSIGYVGLTLFIAMLLVKVYFSFKSREQLNIAFIFFLLIDGLTEPIAFQGPATTTTLVLATVLALNYRHSHATKTHYPSYK
ncbi:MAG: O-antigen ligase family protein [Alphaproteobacteria bacterium]